MRTTIRKTITTSITQTPTRQKSKAAADELAIRMHNHILAIARLTESTMCGDDRSMEIRAHERALNGMGFNRIDIYSCLNRLPAVPDQQ